jgi:hypothetical protein
MARRSAEMGAAYLCAEAGISIAVLENQAATFRALPSHSA